MCVCVGIENMPELSDFIDIEYTIYSFLQSPLVEPNKHDVKNNEMVEMLDHFGIDARIIRKYWTCSDLKKKKR